MCTVQKFIGLIELKWGMLIIAIVDMILGLAAYFVSGRMLLISTHYLFLLVMFEIIHSDVK